MGLEIKGQGPHIPPISGERISKDPVSFYCQRDKVVAEIHGYGIMEGF